MPSKPTRTNPRGQYPLSSFKDGPLLQLRVLYTAFVKGLFAAAPKGEYHWEEGENTEIYVSGETPIRGAIVGARPAVSFTRSSVQFYSLGQDDMLRFNFNTGRKTKTVLIPGVMSINCCSRSDIESEHLAWIVAEHLWLLREVMMGRDLFFEIGRQPQISAPSPAEGIVAADAGDEWYCTTVASPFQFPRMSQFSPLNRHILQELDLQIRQQVQCAKQSNVGPAMSHNEVEWPAQKVVTAPQGYFPEASDVHGRAPDPAGELPDPPPLAPHPLNPAVQVRVRGVHPFRPALRQPTMGGRAIPIAAPCVEESGSTPPFRTKV